MISPRPWTPIVVAAWLAVLAGLARAGEPPIPGFLLVAEDDCGAQGRQPNLVRGSSHSLTQEEQNAADVGDPRLKTFNHGETVQEFPRFIRTLFVDTGD